MKALIEKTMVEEVIAEFEAENPGKCAYDMSSAEFTDRMMKKIKIEGDPLPAGDRISTETKGEV